jgi:murein endopeptidase
VAALEWLGREVAREYSTPEKAGVHLNVADLSAPRGGCIWGRRGRGHASHTTGQDVDMGFLNTRVGAVAENAFTTHFDPQANWWLIKKLFSNPHACVKSVFLDKRHIRKLARAALGDELWPKVAHRIQHVKGHRSHLHVRVGRFPGEPGCPRETGWMNDGMLTPEDEDELGEDEAGQMVRDQAPVPSQNRWEVGESSADALSVSSSAPIPAPKPGTRGLRKPSAAQSPAFR